jgi:hypothetical protein
MCMVRLSKGLLGKGACYTHLLICSGTTFELLGYLSQWRHCDLSPRTKVSKASPIRNPARSVAVNSDCR